MPLRTEGIGIGVLAALDRFGIAVAHFFDLWFAEVPTPALLPALAPADAVSCMMFSAYDLRKGTWPTIGRVGGTWPVPDFCREDLSGRRYRTSYDPADMRDIAREVPISNAEGADLDQDGHNGPGAVEIVLTRLVHPASARPHALTPPDRARRPSPQPSSLPDEPATGAHAVLIQTPLQIDGLERLEQALMATLASGEIGEIDGIERGIGDSLLYLYGPDADRLYQEVAPILRGELPSGSQVIRRYGEPGAREVVEDIP